jgi:hypothetical protein
MSSAPDLPKSLTYVHDTLIWHISQFASPYRPNRFALCGKRAKGEHWNGECQGAWPVGKLCSVCRALLKGVAA